MKKKSLQNLALFLFFFSGATSLIYEVVWTRKLVLIFGGTSYAVSTVLAAFMCGLALGSIVIGKLADRRSRHLMIYGILEIGIGVWAALVPTLFSLLEKLYVSSYSGISQGFAFMTFLRFISTFFVLLVPSSLMGGTLPILVKFLVGAKGELLRKPGLLYASNTFGAVTGTFASGYFLIPSFGLAYTTGIAIALNVIVGASAVVFASSARARKKDEVQASASRPDATVPEPSPATGAEEPGTEESSRESVRRDWIIPLAYALSGFGALALEVIWTKLLCVVLGTTVYAFSAMLTTFLFGLALGSWVFSRTKRIQNADPLIVFGLIQLGVGLLVLLTTPIFGILPILFFKLFQSVGTAWSSQAAVKFLLSFVIMVLPTFLLGGTFPVAARAFCGKMDRIGNRVGILYASNTAGAVFGSLAGGFLLIPVFGRHTSLLIVSTLYVLLGAILLFQKFKSFRPMRRFVFSSAILAVFAALLFFSGRPWDKKLMESGLYVYAADYKNVEDLKQALASQKIIFYEEGREATVSVWKDQEVKFLKINGKTDASTGSDEITQKLIAHLPLLLHKDPKDVLVIGFGSGMSVNSVLHHPVKRVVCAELVPGLLKSARFFTPAGRDFLKDPRFSLVENDGRNYLLLSKEKYDVIVSEPSNPWIAGIGTLFTDEFFKLARSRLNPDGIMCQWIQIYQMSEADLKDVLHTFGRTFPYMMVWMGARSDLVLIGSASPLLIDYPGLARRLSTGLVGQDLSELEINTPIGFISNFIMGKEALSKYLTGSERTVTDNHLTLEYSIPKNLYAKTDLDNLIRLLNAGESAGAYITSLPGNIDPGIFASYLQARRDAITILKSQVVIDAEGHTPLWNCFRLAPMDYLVRGLLSRNLNEAGNQMLAANDLNNASGYFRAAIKTGTFYERKIALSNLGLCFFKLGIPDSATFYWTAAIGLNPENTMVRFNLATLYSATAREDLAAREYREILALDPDYFDALNNLAWSLAENGGSLGEAESLAVRAVKISRTSLNLDTLGWVELKQNKGDKARKIFLEAAELDKTSADIRYHLSLAYSSLGMKKEALKEANGALLLECSPSLREKLLKEVHKSEN